MASVRVGFVEVQTRRSLVRPAENEVLAMCRFWLQALNRPRRAMEGLKFHFLSVQEPGSSGVSFYPQVEAPKHCCEHLLTKHYCLQERGIRSESITTPIAPIEYIVYFLLFVCFDSRFRVWKAETT